MTDTDTPVMRTVVVGCDGSRQAAGALELALRLVDPRDGRLVLANVFPFYRGWSLASTPGAYATVLQEHARTTLQAAEDSIAGRAPGVVRSRVAPADSSVARGLRDVALTHRADAIVLGATHVHLAGRIAGRATVQRLLHGAPCAVAVAAPAGPRPGPVRAIAVAYDGSEESRGALRAAYALAARDGAAVQVCRVAEMLEFGPAYAGADDEERRREMLEACARADVDEAVALAPPGVPAAGIVVAGRPGPAIVAAAEGADLLVCGSRAAGALRRALLGSTAMAVAAHAPTSLLIVGRRGLRPFPAPALAGAAASHPDEES